MFITFPIGDLFIRVESQSAAVLDGFRELLRGWPILSPGQADLTMQFELVERLPAPPPMDPLHTAPTTTDNLPYDFAVYQLEADQLVMHTPGVGMILLSLAAGAVPAVAGLLTTRGLRPDQLENLLVRPLASLLLRRDYYMAHSFTVARDGRAALLVGHSMSGKTTTGLALLGAGWEFLGNDAALLHMRSDGVYALPFPGLPGIRPYTLQLLPWLAETGAVQSLAVGWDQLDVSVWPGRWGEGAKVAAVYFPQISDVKQSRLERLPVSAALSRLLEQSVQKWDKGEIGGRLPFWETLGQQINAYALHLSEETAQIPPLFVPAT